MARLEGWYLKNRVKFEDIKNNYTLYNIREELSLHTLVFPLKIHYVCYMCKNHATHEGKFVHYKSIKQKQTHSFFKDIDYDYECVCHICLKKYNDYQKNLSKHIRRSMDDYMCKDLINELMKYL